LKGFTLRATAYLRLNFYSMEKQLNKALEELASSSQELKIEKKSECQEIGSLTSPAQICSWEEDYLKHLKEDNGVFINPKTGLCFACGAHKHKPFCKFFDFHEVRLRDVYDKQVQQEVLNNELYDDSEWKVLKESHQKSRDRRFERDVRYKAQARAGKIAKGPVQIFKDSQLYDFIKVPFPQIENWFPLGFNKHSKDG